MATQIPSATASCHPDELRSIAGSMIGAAQTGISVTTTDQFKSDLKLAGFPAPGWIENTQAFYEPSSERVVLFADRIPKASAAAVLAHELVHKNGRQLLNDSQWDAVITALKTWANADQKSTEWLLYTKAHAKARYGTQRRPEFYDEELFAYAVEEAFKLGLAPDADLTIETAEGWLARAQGILERLARAEATGEQPVLEAQDVIALAYALAQIERTFDRGELVFSRSAYEAGRQAVSPREVKLFDAATALASRGPLPSSEEFKAWFKGSAVVTDKGAPLVVYHGTNKAFDAFSRETAGTATGDPNAVLGFFFTTSASEAALYAHGEGANVVPVHLRIQKPYEATMDELVSLEAEDYEAMLEDLVAQGHDGIVADDGSHRWFVAFEPNQIVSMFDRNYPVDPLREQARQFEENSSNIYSADDFDWSERTLRREEFLPLVGGESVLDQDRAIEPSQSDLSRPIIVAQEPDGPNLWDGVHRAVSAGKLGLSEIRALVGTYKWGDDLTPVRWRINANKPTDGNGISHDAKTSQLVRQELQSIEEQAKILGVELVLDTPENLRSGVGYTLTVQWFARKEKIDKTKPGRKGSGAQVMQMLTTWADRHEVYIQLGITDDRGARRLQAYYEELGFERTDASDEYDRIMVREPIVDAEIPAFDKWFASSKVVDKQGRPLVVYHGTAGAGWTGDGVRNQFGRINGAGKGAYFTRHPHIAAEYADMDAEVDGGDPAVLPVYLSLQNPYVTDFTFETPGDIDPDADPQAINQVFYDRLVAAGYDGVIIRNTGEFVAFHPEQIKSAIGNNRQFNPMNPDIRHSLATSGGEPVGTAEKNLSKLLAQQQEYLANPVAYYERRLKAIDDELKSKFDIWTTQSGNGNDAKFHTEAGDFESPDNLPEEARSLAREFLRLDEEWSLGETGYPLSFMAGYYEAEQEEEDNPEPLTDRQKVTNLLMDGLRGRLPGEEEPEKSATGNNGDFNQLNPDIRFSQAGHEALDPMPATHARIQFLLASTSPAELADLQPAVAGKTEKPGGTDPTRHLSPTGVYRLGRVPLEIFIGNEEGDRYDGTVQKSRMLDYVSRNGAGAPPVIAAVPKRDPSGKLRILDGGHRISAARHRGDSHINAIVDTRNLGVHLQQIAANTLPEDILDTLQSLYGEVGRDVPPTVSARLIPLSAFPEAPLGGLDDTRGESHTRAMIGKATPPVIVHELDWLDGRHRVWAARQEGREHLLAIDVGFDLPKSVVQAIEPIGRLGLPNATPPKPAWFNTVLTDGEMGEPLMLFHGTRSAGGLDQFIPGGPAGALQRGDAYGVGAYLTTSQSEASVYAGAQGAVLPVYVNGRVLDVDAPLSAELQAQMTALARQHLLPSDKARFGMGRKQQTFDNKADAQAFFDAQRLKWEAFGDRMERCRPEVVSNKDGRFVIEYADYDAPLQIQTPQDLWTLLKAVGFEVVRDYGYDGIMMTRGEDDARHRWVVMYNTLGTIKSAIGNNGDFNPYDPRICHSLVDTSTETPTVDDEDDAEPERMRA